MVGACQAIALPVENKFHIQVRILLEGLPLHNEPVSTFFYDWWISFWQGE
jgi:hypothetical protein